MLDAFVISRMKDVKNQEDLTYRKSSIKPPRGLVSVLHKELEYKVEELKNKKVGGHAADYQNQIRTSSW